jgi:hypothetical protein
LNFWHESECRSLFSTSKSIIPVSCCSVLKLRLDVLLSKACRTAACVMYEAKGNTESSLFRVGNVPCCRDQGRSGEKKRSSCWKNMHSCVRKRNSCWGSISLILITMRQSPGTGILCCESSYYIVYCALLTCSVLTWRS